MDRVPGGLLPKTKDKRDFDLRVAGISLPKLSDLPEIFELDDPFEPYDQTEYADFCSGAMVAELSSLQEGVRLFFPFAFAAGKACSGEDVNSWGNDMRSAFRGQVKYGCPAESDVPDWLKSKPASFLRDIKNYPSEVLEKALLHAKNSFFDVTGPYDPFDNIRAAIYKFAQDKKGVGIGLMWKWPLSDTDPIDYNRDGVGHAMGITKGWVVRHGVPKLKVKQSYGPLAGDGGYVYLPRDIINKNVPVFGAYMFQDMTKEEYLARNRSFFSKQLDSIVGLFKLLVETLFPQQSPTVSVEVVAEPKPQPAPPETMQDMVKRVCREEGMSIKDSDEIYRTIECESGFNPRAKNENNDRLKTTDYGICQYNSHWYIGPGKPIPSVEVALNDPEFCVRVMCDAWRKGRKRDWICARKLGFK